MVVKIRPVAWSNRTGDLFDLQQVTVHQDHVVGLASGGAKSGLT